MKTAVSVVLGLGVLLGAPRVLWAQTTAPTASAGVFEASSSPASEASNGSPQSVAPPSSAPEPVPLAESATTSVLPEPVVSETVSPPGPAPEPTPGAGPTGFIPAGAPAGYVAPPPVYVAQPAPAALPPTSPALTPGWSWVDTVAAEPPPPAIAPKRNPFRGSRFDWTHNVTTSTLGVGQDYLSSSYQGYQQSFSLLLAYFPYDGDRFRVRLAMAPGLDVAFTNSDVTTTEREPLLRDLPLLVGGSVIVAMEPERSMSTIIAPNVAFFLPTSKASWNSGDYLTVSPRVSLSQQLPLFGAGAAAFDDIDLWLQLRYDHLFSRGATPIDDDLNRPTLGTGSSTTYSDVLDGSQNAPNAFRVDLSLAFSEELFGQPLMLSLNVDYRLAQLYGVAPYEVETTTGSVTVEPDPDARTWRQGVGFGVDATYQLMRTMSVAVGYAACGNELCPARGVDVGNSTYKTPFYTPHAIFWGGLILHVDTVLDLLINGDKTNSSVLRRDLAAIAPVPRF